MDVFIGHPLVQLRCMSYYFMKRLPNYNDFLELLPELLPIAIDCGLVVGNEDYEVLYKKLIDNPEVKNYLC